MRNGHTDSTRTEPSGVSGRLVSVQCIAPVGSDRSSFPPWQSLPSPAAHRGFTRWPAQHECQPEGLGGLGGEEGGFSRPVTSQRTVTRHPWAASSRHISRKGRCCCSSVHGRPGRIWRRCSRRKLLSLPALHSWTSPSTPASCFSLARQRQLLLRLHVHPRAMIDQNACRRYRYRRANGAKWKSRRRATTTCYGRVAGYPGDLPMPARA